MSEDKGEGYFIGSSIRIEAKQIDVGKHTIKIDIGLSSLTDEAVRMVCDGLGESIPKMLSTLLGGGGEFHEIGVGNKERKLN